MDLSIVVPCYNEEGNVELFYEEVQKVFKGKKIKYEIVFVNDGSSDNTLDRLTNIVDQKKQNIKVINFSRNFGKEAAMYAGLKEAEGELVTIIDADLQQRPELILRMIDILNENEQFDSVAAFQEVRKEGKVLTFFKDTFYKVINSMSTVPFVQGASDFRTFRRKVVDSILELSEYHRFSKGIFSFVGYNTYYLPYEVEERNSGTSKWNFFKLFNYAIDGIVAFTTSPLRAPFYISIVTFLVGFIYFIVALFKGVSEFTVILLVMLFLFSLLFMVVGVIGEYLSRTYIQVKQRPIYIVKEILLLIGSICEELTNPKTKLFKWGLGLYYKNKEIINYLIVGGLTTLVSIGSYALFRVFISNYMVCTVLSWIAAVLFAYITNRVFVFESKDKNVLAEFVKFVSCRKTK